MPYVCQKPKIIKKCVHVVRAVGTDNESLRGDRGGGGGQQKPVSDVKQGGRGTIRRGQQGRGVGGGPERPGATRV